MLGLVDASTVGQLIDHMAARDAAGGLQLINQLVADGVELGELVDQIMGYLRAILFAQVVHATDGLDLPEEAAAAVMRQAEALTPAATLSALREYSEARGLLRDQVPGAPQLPIEMAFLRTALMPGAAPTAQAGSNAATAPMPARQVPAVRRTGHQGSCNTGCSFRKRHPPRKPYHPIPSRPARGGTCQAAGRACSIQSKDECRARAHCPI